MPVRLVCFDLGGVLVQICRSWSDGCRAAGLDVRGNSAGDRAGKIRHDLSERFGLGELSEDEWAEQLSRELGGLYSASDLKRVHHAWTKKEYPGALALVDALHERTIETACLSNTNHAHWARLIHHDGNAPLPGDPEYPAVHRLRHRHASHLLRLAKPNRAIYEAFQAATGHAPSEILFFDDAPDNVAAARAVGWNAERVNPHADTVGQMRRHLRSFDVSL